MDNSKNKYSQKEWAMFAIFPVIKASSMLFLQPISKTAIVQQKSAMASSGPLNMKLAIRYILNTRGAIGFYDGLVSSMTREGYKTCYKGLLQVNASDVSNNLVPVTSYGAYFLRGAIAGTMVGTLDSILVAPFERYRTYRVSQDKPGHFFNYIKEIQDHHQQPNGVVNRQGFIKEIYRGLGVTICKQSLMNVSFFSTKAWANGAMKPYENDYPVITIIFASIAAGFGAALVGAPLDIVKTLKQQQTGKKTSAKVLLNQVYGQAGFQGLFVGVPARFILITSAYGLNGLFLNIFDKIRHQESDIDELTDKFEKLSLTTKPLIFSQPLANPNNKMDINRDINIEEETKLNKDKRLGRE